MANGAGILMEMIHLALRTGYTFKQVFGHLNETLDLGIKTGCIGISDLGSTFSHPYIEQQSEKINVKPLYSVRLTVVENAVDRVKPRGQFGCEYIFIAKNNSGLREIYNLVKIFYDNFYFRGNISLRDVFNLTEDVIVITENFNDPERIDYIAITPTTAKMIKNYSGIPKVAIINNFYPRPLDKDAYELFTSPNSNSQTYQQHIFSTKEWLLLNKSYPEAEEAVKNTHVIADACDHIILDKAPMIKFKGDQTIEFLCKIGAKKLGIDLSDPVYKKRYEKELKLINEKNYQDYFLVVADMIKKAKKKMLVGPGRGSSGGSLICHLIGITEGIDPIEYDLLFERFIDINRSDLPDIDIDFPDNKRQSVIKQLVTDYGSDKVKHVATISTMKPKIAIVEFAKSLGIPLYEIENLKNSIIERPPGDSRAKMRLIDTFETTDIGKEFLNKYPAMKEVSKLENHPRHSGVHAGGIIVCNEPIHNYSGINTRDTINISMVDKKTSEYLNLLKIDCLGLRTLSILEETAKMIGMKHTDYYSIKPDCELTFSIFNDMRLSGIFQFEGHSVGALTRQMGIHKFEDIVAITSLARPGALYSGGASRYIKYRLGEETPVFLGKSHKEITKNTFGIVVYQEQILRISREIGNMSWEDVNALRKALSKSLGKEYFSKYKEKLIEGAIKNGYSEGDAEFIWGEIENGGAYAFNKSHAVAYSLVSYWCAYMKIRHPKEFTVANLNNSKSVESAIKILRDATTVDGLEYMAIDPDESLKKWTVNSDGVIVGALTNIDGIGPKKADKIISARKTGEKIGDSLTMKMINSKTDYDILFPCDHYWGDIYKNYRLYGLSAPPTNIIEVQDEGEYLIIGKLMSKTIKDLNDYVNVQKRDGKSLDGDSLMLSMKIEDDTDSIICSIGRFDYEEKALVIVDYGEVDEDWYLIRGQIKYGRYLNIREIMKLHEGILENKREIKNAK